jgi:hypothetical protein
MGQILRANTTHVVHETIDGETILIHLGTGTYYSLVGVGSEVWQLLAAGTTREALTAQGLERYTGEALEVELGLAGFVDALLREELVTEADGAEADAHLPEGQTAYAVPVLEAYTDMQEFMLVDPLHEVDEVAGWPHASAG